MACLSSSRVGISTRSAAPARTIATTAINPQASAEAANQRPPQRPSRERNALDGSDWHASPAERGPARRSPQSDSRFVFMELAPRNASSTCGDDPRRASRLAAVDVPVLTSEVKRSGQTGRRSHRVFIGPPLGGLLVESRVFPHGDRPFWYSGVGARFAWCAQTEVDVLSILRAQSGSIGRIWGMQL